MKRQFTTEDRAAFGTSSGVVKLPCGEVTGKARCTGQPDQLAESQAYPLAFGVAMHHEWYHASLVDLSVADSDSDTDEDDCAWELWKRRSMDCNWPELRLYYFAAFLLVPSDKLL